jgi:hypothetical protein
MSMSTCGLGGVSAIGRFGMFALVAAAGSLMSASPAKAQAVNLSGTWVGKDGAEVTFTHHGGSLSGPAWGGANNPTLTGSMNLTLSSDRPMIFRGRYENKKGNLRGFGEVTITVHDKDTIFCSYKGVVTDGRQSTPIQDSGFAKRK